MNSNIRNFALWVIIALCLIASFSIFQAPFSGKDGVQDISYSQFIKDIDAGRIRKVAIVGRYISGTYVKGESSFQTYVPVVTDKMLDKLQAKDVEIFSKPVNDSSPSMMSYLSSWFPLIVVVFIWIFFMRQIQGGGARGAMGFGKSKAKLLSGNGVRITFDDVAGVDEAKEDLQEIVDFLCDPQKFKRLGGRIPHGVLLVGPPGTGKTLLARAVAGEANVPFFTISGSDFVELFVGVGASRVRDMFEQAKNNSPCIIFVDEIDAVGRHRGIGLGGGNDEREQTLNQLLVEMDGFESSEGVILIAATNRPDVLDPALLRPGRFDRQITVPNPDVVGRERILKVHSRNVPLAPNVVLKTIARGTPGFSGADLRNLVNEAALVAARRNRRLVTMQEFEDAKDKILMGAERRSTVMTEAEKKITAYHEAGHAVVACHVPQADPLHKATIIPRGRALGMVMQLPEADRHSSSYTWMISRLAILMGGRVAEEIIFGKENVTSGAMSDIEYATKLARVMVTQFGFSDLLGRVFYGESQQDISLGHPISRSRSVSEDTAHKIDKEVFRLIDEAYQKARSIIEEKNNDFVAIAEGLLEYETLSGKEIASLIKGEKINRSLEDDDNSMRCASVPKAGISEEEIHGSEKEEEEYSIDSTKKSDDSKEESTNI
ncbi:cell division protein FtsH [Candidatus Liberibacter solanacearum]|uniref:ATP-dependent zinc metalloprotease FtsH n=1 Tax=Candidatus Liberibacter solanacearum TaxID=556287 RepID=A0A094YZZ0_9HYPH|nr:ATP-dependent zinc metalloprotease FtsH [Candidatus Liberibacter solanacearum]KGB27545.1 cell division protein FtsH [Candidatus Liberibacter solanacearum]KJZ80790.1 cell division protein FtsH [Candidatus Liberibacter solanacearum]KJZ81903.1 Cell division protein FtsH [Candidatus Liberibacter solanacearum]KQC49646.1 cell division protein FtsH [Candidatus Liberibacter solanacearum]